MCTNCRTLPKNRVVRNPDEFFRLLDLLNENVNENHLEVVSATHSIADIMDGEVDNPFKADLLIITQCPECGNIYVFTFEKYKGAHFERRNSLVPLQS